MELLHQCLSLIQHLDQHLDSIITSFGPWTYGLMFLIIFCETGLVVTPFLPGDSLLFALGTCAARGSLDLVLLVVLLCVAAVLGDTVNYWIGAVFGKRLFSSPDSRLFNRRHLERTHDFYERYGGKTIVLARFVPIVRTFAPFVAGMGRMTYVRFMSYNIVGGLVWIVAFLAAGYQFGQFEWVKKNFTHVVFAIIFLSILPAIIEIIRERRRLRQAARA